jgi:hypothetical protein
MDVFCSGKLSEQKLLMLSGKRSTKNGPRGQPRNCPNGSESDQAKRLVLLKLPKVMRKVKVLLLRRKKKRRKRKKRRRRRRRRKRSKFFDPQVTS